MGPRAVRRLATFRQLVGDVSRHLRPALSPFAQNWAGDHACSRAASCAETAGLRRRLGRALSAAGAIGAFVGVAYADGIAVMDRPRPEYDPKGIPLGGFRLYPATDLSLRLTNNVFQTNASRKSDVAFQFAPAFKLTSEWSQNFLEVFGRLSTLQYADHTSENLTDWSLGAEGRLDIRRGSAVFAGISKTRLHESRSSPNAPGNIAEPIEYSLDHAHASVSVQPNRVRFLVSGDVDRYSYEATPLNGGGLLDNSDRDRTEYRLLARVSTEIADGYSGFLEGAYDRHAFERDIDRTGVNRDSSGFAVNTGIEVELAELLQGEFFIGYVDRHFGAPLQDFSGFNYGSTLKWSATPITTVHITASRVFDDTTIAGSSMIANKTLGVGVDHELRRNLLIQANVNYVGSEFKGLAREDDSVEVRVGATYLIDRHLRATADYERRQRESNAPGEGFAEDRINIGVHLQL